MAKRNPQLYPARLSRELGYGYEISLASGSLDGNDFTGVVSSSYPLSNIKDLGSYTYTQFSGSLPGYTGVDFDLRGPYISAPPFGHPIHTSTATSTTASISEYVTGNPGGGFWDLTTLDNLIDNDNSTAVSRINPSSNIPNGAKIGFKIDFEEPVLIEDIKLRAATADTLDFRLKFEIKYEGETTYVNDSSDGDTLRMFVVGSGYSYYFRYGNDTFNSNHGVLSHGNITPKKITSVRFYHEVSGANPLSGDLQLYGLIVNAVAEPFTNPDGVYLNKVQLQTYFGVGSGTQTFDCYTSNDAKTFDYIGSMDVNGISLTPNEFTVNSFENKVKIFRLVNKQDSYNERIYDAKFYVWDSLSNPLSVDGFEFNDSVLDTKAWNSSRYDGRQISAAKLNEFTVGDSTYGKTPAVERYSRNIYIGNAVIDIDGDMDGNEFSVTRLLPVNDFSYLQTNYFITINDDGSITHTRIEEKQNDISKKKRFYQSFFDDFPNKSSCNIITFDQKNKTNLKPSYTIYFNEGQLERLWSYPATTHKLTVSRRTNSGQNLQGNTIDGFANSGQYLSGISPAYYTSSNSRDFAKITAYDKDNSGVDPKAHLGILVPNTNTIEKFFGYDITSSNSPFLGQNDGRVNLNQHIRLYEAAFEYKNNSDYIDNKKLYWTFIAATEQVGARFTNYSAIRTNNSSSIPFGSTNAILSNSLTELSTVEIVSASLSSSFGSFHNQVRDELKIHFHRNYTLHQNYFSFPAVFSYDTGQLYPGILDGTNVEEGIESKYQQPLVMLNGGAEVSMLNNDMPSLLVNLKASVELPEGIGDKPFVILPDNIHPYVRDNINLYLSKAGIDISGNATDSIEEIKQNKPRRPRLSPVQRRAQKRRQAVSREQWMNQDSEKERRKEERKNRRAKRKENRQEKRKNRREDRQNRREDRRENRQNKKENRQNKRQERKDNRQDKKQNRKENRKNRRKRRRNR